MLVIIIGLTSFVSATDWYGDYYSFDNNTLNGENTNSLTPVNNADVTLLEKHVGIGSLNLVSTKYVQNTTLDVSNTSTIDFWMYLASVSADDPFIEISSNPNGVNIWTDGGGGDGNGDGICQEGETCLSII